MESYVWDLDGKIKDIVLSINNKIKFAERTIKHPHFKYAIIDLDTNKIIYKWKKPWKWFNGKRIVIVAPSYYQIKLSGVADYKRD